MNERERQYREYLALRQHQQENEIKRKHDGESGNIQSDEKYGSYFKNNSGSGSASPEQSSVPSKHTFNRNSHRSVSSVTGTPYGVSELRKKQKEKEQHDREMQEYLAARADAEAAGTGSSRKSARKGKQIAYSDYRDYEPSGRGRRNKKHANGNPGGKSGGTGVKPGSGGKAYGVSGKKRKKRTGLRIALVSMLIIVLCAAGVAGAGATVVWGTLNSMEKISIDEGSIGIDPTVDSQLSGYRNIAVLGVDARADEDDSQCRSDAIIVASINEETGEIKMFSVYRDTLLDVGDEGLDKITHAYFYGGAERSLYALNRNMNLNIREAVVISWKTVADVIDSVGGIEIDVQDSEIDEMNKYIPETADNVDGSDDPIEEAGKQTLNGVQAVTYSRIRKDAVTGDYRRNERMKIVFKETFKKVKSAGYLTMYKVARKAMPEVKTNLTAGDIFKLMLDFKNFDMTDSTTGFPYDVSSWTGYGGAGYAWYGPPVNLANNVSKLHKQFFDQEDYTPTETVQSISNDISYLTGIY